MAKIHITPNKINEIFGQYDDCQEEPVECGIRVRVFLKELLKSKSIPKSREEKTMRLLDALKQNIGEAKRSEESSALDPNSIIMSEKRKIDEQNLRLTLTRTKEWLNSLVEYQRLESLSVRYAVLASIVSAAIAVGATYALSVFYPFSTWALGRYTWEIGLIVTLITTFYIWRSLKFNSSTTQTVVAIVVAPIIIVITTIIIVLAASALTSAILMAANGNMDLNLFLAPQPPMDLAALMAKSSKNAMLIIGLLVSIVVGIMIAILAGIIVQRVIGIEAFKPPHKEDIDETEDDSLS